MSDINVLGPWVRRFLLEHIVAERNLALNTQRSYRDALRLLLPFAAHSAVRGSRDSGSTTSRLTGFGPSCES